MEKKQHHGGPSIAVQLAKAILGAGAGAFLWNLTALDSAPDAASLQLLGETLRAPGGPPPNASLALTLLLRAHEVGGLAGLRWAWIAWQMLQAFFGFLIFALAIIGWNLLQNRRQIPQPVRLWGRRILVGALILLGLGLVWRVQGAVRNFSPPEEFFPGQRWLAAWAELAQGKLVFANPSLRARAALLAPDLRLDSTEDLSGLLQDPVRWRQHQGSQPAEAVILSGRVEEFSPLLRHLQRSPDWQLVEVAPQGLVFWRAPALEERQRLQSGESFTLQGGELQRNEKLPQASPNQRAVAAARQALVHAQVEEYGPARRLLEHAKQLAPNQPEVLALSAAFLALRQQWPEAAAESQTALALNPRLAAAWQILLQSQLAMQQPRSANASARRLQDLAQSDDFSWFLIARAANESNDPALEIRALEKLIALSRSRRLPLGPYLIYLGQAQARMGLDRAARAAWQEALQSGELTQAQTEQVQALLQRLDQAVPPPISTP